jgi:hypothetical protein
VIVNVFAFLLLSDEGTATVPTVHKPCERKLVFSYFLFGGVAALKDLLYTLKECG